MTSEYNKNHLKDKNSTTKLFDSDTNDNILNKTDSEEIISKKITNSIKNKFQTLIDSESDEERKDDEELLNPIKHDKTKKYKEKYSKVKKVSLRASKEEAMKQIHSETQRLIRETEISLPYHKPKQRTLQEFLNRKKVITALPKAPTMAAKLKMSSIIVDEVLKEKEKEAEIFYKSSDSEDETKEINKENTDKEMNINMQDLKKNNVSRKLFIDNNLSILESNKEKNDIMKEINETLTETKETEYNNTIINDKTKENETNLEIAEIHCEFNKIENNNVMSKLSETAKNEKEDDLLQTDFSQNKNKEKDIYIDNNKYDSEIINKHSDISTSKNNNDYAKIVKQSLGITTDESDEYNEYGLPPPKFDESPDIIKKKTLLN
ncbi:claspin-like [Apis mellifera carnica]|nr:claspin-like [Apis mellifera carnica]